MLRMLVLYALIHGGCVATSEIQRGSYAQAMINADRCDTPVSWVEHTDNDPDAWHAVCGDSSGHPISQKY